MNTLDIVIGVLCLGSAILGVALGPLRQIFKLGGLVLGLVLAKRYFGWAQDFMGLRFVHGDAVAYVILLAAVYVCARLVGYAVEYSLRGDKLSGSERLTGGIAGFVHGAVVSVLVVFVLLAVSPRETPLFRESKLAPAAIAAAGWLKSVFPEKIRDSLGEKARVAEGGTAEEKAVERRNEDEGVRGKAKAAAPPAPAPHQSKKRPRK